MLLVTETHLNESITYCIDQHAFYFSSGKAKGTGVGVIVAPHFRPYIAAVIPHTDRIIEVQVSTRGHNSTFIGTYAPHQGTQHDEHRDEYWDELGNIISKHPPSSPIYVMGDFNARLHARKLDEQHVIGPHIIGLGLNYIEGTPDHPPTPQPNRKQIIDLAHEKQMVIANTFKSPKFEHRASYREISTKRGSPITPEAYTQLDHMLVSKSWLPSVFHTRTYPYQEWSSNHYLMIAIIQVRLGARNIYNTPEPQLQYRQQHDHEQELCNNYFNDRIRQILHNNRFAILADHTEDTADPSPHQPTPPHQPTEVQQHNHNPHTPPHFSRLGRRKGHSPTGRRRSTYTVPGSHHHPASLPAH